MFIMFLLFSSCFHMLFSALRLHGTFASFSLLQLVLQKYSISKNLANESSGYVHICSIDFRAYKLSRAAWELDRKFHT